jgi:hypothetical protein
MGSDPVVHNVNIHITGELKLNYEGSSGYTVVPSQGPIDSHAPTKISDGMGGSSKPAEPDIRPEFFADTGTPEVNFGIDSEESPKGTPD